MGDAVTAWVLAYDDGRDAGLGHRRRLEALADTLAARGESIDLRPAHPPIRAPRLVVDSYRHRADDRGLFAADILVALDDLGRDLDVDVLVDPSPGADARAHPAARHVLAGATYALIDPAVTAASTAPVADTVRRILVTFGTADRGGKTAAAALAVARALPHARVRVPVGPFFRGALPPGVEPIDAPRGLVSELAASDLVVTAGGVTFLESLCLGRPTIVLVTAENQRRAAEHAARIGAAVLATSETLVSSAMSLVADASRRRAVARHAAELVDGRGTERVAAAIRDLVPA